MDESMEVGLAAEINAKMWDFEDKMNEKFDLSYVEHEGANDVRFDFPAGWSVWARSDGVVIVVEGDAPKMMKARIDKVVKEVGLINRVRYS